MDHTSYSELPSVPSKLQYMNYIKDHFSDFTDTKLQTNSLLYSLAVTNRTHYYNASKSLIKRQLPIEYPAALSSIMSSANKTALFIREINHTLISTSSHVYLWNIFNPTDPASLYCFPSSSEIIHCAVSNSKLGVFGASIKKVLITVNAQNNMNLYLLQYNNSNNSNKELEVPSSILRSDFNLNLGFNVVVLFTKDKEIFVVSDRLEIYEIEYFSNVQNCGSNKVNDVDELNLVHSTEKNQNTYDKSYEEMNGSLNSYLSYKIVKHTNNQILGRLESFYNYISTPKRAKLNSFIKTGNENKKEKDVEVIDSFMDQLNELFILYRQKNKFYICVYSINDNRNSTLFTIFNKQKISQTTKVEVKKGFRGSFPIKITSPFQYNRNISEINAQKTVRAVVVTDKGDRLLFGYTNKSLLLGYSSSISFSYIKTIPCNTVHKEYNDLNSTIFQEEREDGVRRMQNDAVSSDKLLENITNKNLITISEDLFAIIFNNENKLHVYKYDADSNNNNDNYNNGESNYELKEVQNTYRNNIQLIEPSKKNSFLENNVAIELADFNEVPNSFLLFTLSKTLYVLTTEGLLIYNINSILTDAKLKLTESFEQNNFEELFQNEKYLTSLLLNVSLPYKEKYPKLFPTNSSYSNLNALQTKSSKTTTNKNRLVSAYNKNISFSSKNDLSYSEIIGNIYSTKTIDKTNTQLKNLLGGLLEGIEFSGIKKQINKKIEIAFIKCLTLLLKDVFKKSLFSLITNKKYSTVLKEVETNIYNLPLNYWISLPANLRILVETIKEIILVLCFLSDFNVNETDVLYTRLTPLKNALESLTKNENNYLKDILFYHLTTSQKSQKLLAKLFESYIYCLEQDFILYSKYNGDYSNVESAYEVNRELGVLEKEKRIKSAKEIIKECPHLFNKDVTIKNEYTKQLEECLKNNMNEMEVHNILNEILLNNNQESTYNEVLIKEVMNLLINKEVYSVCFYFILKVYQIHHKLRTINTLTALYINKDDNKNNLKVDKGNDSYQREIDICLKELMNKQDYKTIIKNVTSFNNIAKTTNSNYYNKENSKTHIYSSKQKDNKKKTNDGLEIIRPIEYILKKLFTNFKQTFEVIKICLNEREFEKTLNIIELYLIKENKENELCVIYTELGLHIKAALLRDKRASSNYKKLDINERIDLLYKANSNLSILQHNNNGKNTEDYNLSDLESFKNILRAKIKTAHLQQEVIRYNENYDFMSNVREPQKVNNLFRRCKNYLLNTDELYSTFSEIEKYEGCILIHEITNSFKYSEIQNLIEKIKEVESKRGSLMSSYNWKWIFKKRLMGLIPRLEKEENREMVKRMAEKYNY